MKTQFTQEAKRHINVAVALKKLPILELQGSTFGPAIFMLRETFSVTDEDMFVCIGLHSIFGYRCQDLAELIKKDWINDVFFDHIQAIGLVEEELSKAKLVHVMIDKDGESTIQTLH